MIENIDVGGPTLIRAAAKNFDYAAVVVTPESYDAVLDELRGSEGMLSGRTREASRSRPSPTRRATTPRSRAGSPSARTTSRRSTRCRSRRSSTFRYGENPHQRAALLRRGRRAHAPALDGVEAPRQGAVVQQPARPRLGAPPRRRVRAAGRRDHQAQQPVRRGRRRAPGRRLRAGARHGPPERLRRRLLLQPAGRARARAAPQLHVRGGGARARGSPTRRSRSSRPSPTSGCSRTRSGGARRSPSTT